MKLAAIRQGDWKLFLHTPGDDTEAISAEEDGKKSKKGDGKKAGGKSPGLYNLADDPSETKDVSATHPEIVAKLLAEATQRDAEITKNKRPAGIHKDEVK